MKASALLQPLHQHFKTSSPVAVINDGFCASMPNYKKMTKIITTYAVTDRQYSVIGHVIFTVTEDSKFIKKMRPMI